MMLRSRRATRRICRGFCGLTAALLLCSAAVSVRGEDEGEKVEKAAKPDERLAEKRLEVMRDHARGLKFKAAVRDWPKQVEPTPIFRYDDQTRGYVDGTVWRLGAKGRPLAIVTDELHPNYLGGGPRVIYDLLSLTPQPFEVDGKGIAWRPRGSAVEMRTLPKGPAPAGTAAGRLSQIKALAQRFSATQDLDETDRVLVHLRRLPREIDRYAPVPESGEEAAATADGGIFLFVNGRNPSIVLLIETDGTAWQYGAGRLSLPSTLTLRLDDAEVWKVLTREYPANGSYTATNVTAEFP